MQVASLAPSLPQLLAPPRLVERPSALGTRPSDMERAKLAELAAEPPRLLSEPKPVSRKAPAAGSTTSWTGELRVAAADPAQDAKAMQRLREAVPVSRDTQFVPAPAYDEEHPEELSYRPFPIAPLLTLTASADDPALARMVHPDLAKTLEFIDQGTVGLADAAARRAADGAGDVGAAVQGRGRQLLQPDRPGSLRPRVQRQQPPRAHAGAVGWVRAKPVTHAEDLAQYLG